LTLSAIWVVLTSCSASLAGPALQADAKQRENSGILTSGDEFADGGDDI